MKKFIFPSPAYIIVILFLLSTLNSCGQNRASNQTWKNPENLTNLLDANGVIELSGLHWNPNTNRLYAIQDNGGLYVLQLDKVKNKFTQVGYMDKLGRPEGVTQVDYNSNEFYTIDEKKYEIRRYTHNADFSGVTLIHRWNLLSENSDMPDTGNNGPEGIVFIPDKYLKAIGFVSSETDEKYTSKKGMGGLIFLAHQKKGMIWVYDVNPDKDDDFTFVGKYKTDSNESCDLAFDRSTGLLYILHNIDGNSLEVTDLSTKGHMGKLQFITKTSYKVPVPTGSQNIEGFAVTPKFADVKNVRAWFCRDISIDENPAEAKDCLWQFSPFASEGNFVKNWNDSAKTKLK